MLQQPHWKLCQKIRRLDAIEQNASSRLAENSAAIWYTYTHNDVCHVQVDE